MKQYISLFVILFFTGAVAAQVKLVPVDAGSKIQFSIRNFGFNTSGTLSGLKGQVIFDKNNLTGAFFDVAVNTASIDTDNNRRDNHLKGDDYFNVAVYPVIRIWGKPVATTNGYVLKANISIKNITKTINIPFTFSQKDNGILFESHFEINRLHFNVGGKSISLSDQVRVDIQLLAK